jgi:hypothetical protein
VELQPYAELDFYLYFYLHFFQNGEVDFFQKVRVDLLQKIGKTIQEYYPEVLGDQASGYGRDFMKLPMIKELEGFQNRLQFRRYAYICFMEQPYQGKYRIKYTKPNKKDRPSKTKYHGGLMTSRLLASAEQVIILSLYQRLLKVGCIPLCLEHDGIFVLSNGVESFKKCREYANEVSRKLIGAEIDLESKDFDYDD